MYASFEAATSLEDRPTAPQYQRGLAEIFQHMPHLVALREYKEARFHQIVKCRHIYGPLRPGGNPVDGSPRRMIKRHAGDVDDRRTSVEITTPT